MCVMWLSVCVCLCVYDVFVSVCVYVFKRHVEKERALMLVAEYLFL